MILPITASELICGMEFLWASLPRFGVVYLRRFVSVSLLCLPSVSQFNTLTGTSWCIQVHALNSEIYVASYDNAYVCNRDIVARCGINFYFIASTQREHKTQKKHDVMKLCKLPTQALSAFKDELHEATDRTCFQPSSSSSNSIIHHCAPNVKYKISHQLTHLTL